MVDTESAVDSGEQAVCDICGKPFKPYCKGQLRCSFACRQEANRRNTRNYMRMKRRAEKEANA